MEKKMKRLIYAIMTVMLMFTMVLLPVDAALDENFKIESSGRAGSSIKVQTPVLTRVHNTNDSISVWWNPVKDARGYVVYRRINSGSWKKVKTTNLTFFYGYGC